LDKQLAEIARVETIAGVVHAIVKFKRCDCLAVNTTVKISARKRLSYIWKHNQ
jgi:hypothetical protein